MNATTTSGPAQSETKHFELTLFGNKSTTAALLDHLERKGIRPDLLVTLDDAARGKAAIAGGDAALAERFEKAGGAVYRCSSYTLKSDGDREFFAHNTFGLGLCTGWQRLIPPFVLERFEAGVFGFHGSCMQFPNGRGRSPLNWSLRLGADGVYHNCFRYDAGADDGDLFATSELAIAKTDDIAALQFKALQDIKQRCVELVEHHRAGEIPLHSQPAGAAIWLPKLTPEDSRLQFAKMPLGQLVDIVRASSRPFDGAFAQDGPGERITLWRAKAYDGPVDSQWRDALPGTVIDAAGHILLLRARDGYLLVDDYEGERPQPFRTRFD